MAEEQHEEQTSEQPRDPRGRFAPKDQSDDHGASSPNSSDYTKMNSYLAKQLGLTDKLADFQTQYNPSDLFRQLSFMADNTTQQPQAKQKGRLPPNEPTVPISPPQPKHEFPKDATVIGEPDLSEEGYSVSLSVDPRKLLQPKTKEK